MAILSAQEFEVCALGRRRIVYAPAARRRIDVCTSPRTGSHRSLPMSIPSAGWSERFADAETVQAVLGDWERRVTAAPDSPADVMHPQQPDRRPL